ncbi:5-formyltetrahydrofolate cyclo-ligase [Aquabacterium sp. A7-Y]|uniref:5-formyltetrahydrofolate cyclo-ligase n=1 Tax=Aquabacterium sp. A7-Y TaxID=1349605 RepID=UPI00223E1733|nr:5-formyltetrahydrofolate cyclo-ligase [Aquabacterium sp. A7-Y]MCW7539311.1 5-formyltetrahydrofolate cyclo-ligase [Aquabacterium sp. A7-Y]
MDSSVPAELIKDRASLRRHLLGERERWAAGLAGAGQWQALQERLGQHLQEVLLMLEPQLLGVYWPIRSEFNAAVALQADKTLAALPLALPWARREPREMEYRRWSAGAATEPDECGIPSVTGPPVVPDVVLVPCVGYHPEGFRLGYGGGYFDRWLARHPHVTAVGVAWAGSEVRFTPEPHDLPLMLIVTEQGVLSPAG